MRAQVIGRISRVETPCSIKNAKSYHVLTPPSFKEHLSSAFGQKVIDCQRRKGRDAAMYRPDLVDDGESIRVVPVVVFPRTGFCCRQQDVGISENGKVIILVGGHPGIKGPFSDTRS